MSQCFSNLYPFSVYKSASKRKTFDQDGFGHLIYKIPDNSKNILFCGTNSQKL